jgi:hypothetical protein
MVATNARDILAKENEFLEELIEVAENYSQQGGVAAAVFDGWVKGLARHRDINLKLINADDPTFDREIKEESDLLNRMLTTMKGGGDVSTSWQKHFEDDIALLKMLA